MSVEERDFYDALFRKSKTKFNSFVDTGKVLNHYMHILDLLMRLRQCCNHPFLVLSRANCDDIKDLTKFSKR